MSLLEITREEDGVTIELPPSVLRFLSANTELPELLDLFLPVVAADGSGNLIAFKSFELKVQLSALIMNTLTSTPRRLAFPRTSPWWRLWTGAGPYWPRGGQTDPRSPGSLAPSLVATHRVWFPKTVALLS